MSIQVKNNAHYPPLSLAWSIWVLGALFYLVAFYQRVAPAVMTNELMEDFNIGAAGLGQLSAYYFYSYVAMQVPTGLLADRYGPRKLLAVGALFAALGTGIFSVSEAVAYANFGRLIIGGSVAVAYVGLLKLAGHWLSPKQYSLSSGVALFIGVIGAVFAGVPLRLLVDEMGWRAVMAYSAVATFAVAVLIWWLVRDDPQDKGYKSYALRQGAEKFHETIGVFNSLKRVLAYRNIWILFLVPGGIVGSILSFAGLWGVPYLTTHYAMQQTEAAAVCSMLMISWAIGGPLFGWFCDYVGYRKRLYVISTSVLLVCWSAIILVQGWPLWALIGLLITAGFFSGCMVIGFAFARESAPLNLSGTVSGLINMGVMLGPMLLQPAVGFMLESAWQGEVSAAGTRVYSIEAFQSGFTLMLVWLVVSLLLILFSKESYCKQME